MQFRNLYTVIKFLPWNLRKLRKLCACHRRSCQDLANIFAPTACSVAAECPLMSWKVMLAIKKHSSWLILGPVTRKSINTSTKVSVNLNKSQRIWRQSSRDENCDSIYEICWGRNMTWLKGGEILRSRIFGLLSYFSRCCCDI